MKKRFKNQKKIQKKLKKLFKKIQLATKCIQKIQNKKKN